MTFLIRTLNALPPTGKKIASSIQIRSVSRRFEGVGLARITGNNPTVFTGTIIARTYVEVNRFPGEYGIFVRLLKRDGLLLAE
ncbi:hypothetical protein [uncultured Gemmiger sp.]|uniref:hypothetical protein n=1 Tax=uncultured Gemmiger sp. TaxID=1623490 RepID=UPI0025E2B1BA|nr:hypothetical protein [uncultured Gemmiger sp.]